VSAWAIIAAAGEGMRLGAGPKAFVPLGGVPMLAHSLIAFAKASAIEAIVVAVPPEKEEEAKSIATSTVPAARVEVVAGAGSRQASVREALAAIPDHVYSVVVHDAARPLVTVELIESALEGLEIEMAAIVAVPERDTLKRERDGRVFETVPRVGLWRAQTPQAFRTGPLRRAHERAVADGFEATDDAMLLERIGTEIAIMPGDERNLKVTTPDDLALAEALLAAAQRRP
jgi:2-C-methyl-D-erythritol 4-phosphate cytidylyltransferase